MANEKIKAADLLKKNDDLNFKSQTFRHCQNIQKINGFICENEST